MVYYNNNKQEMTDQEVMDMEMGGFQNRRPFTKEDFKLMID